MSILSWTQIDLRSLLLTGSEMPLGAAALGPTRPPMFPAWFLHTNGHNGQGSTGVDQQRSPAHCQTLPKEHHLHRDVFECVRSRLCVTKHVSPVRIRMGDDLWWEHC